MPRIRGWGELDWDGVAGLLAIVTQGIVPIRTQRRLHNLPAIIRNRNGGYMLVLELNLDRPIEKWQKEFGSYQPKGWEEAGVFENEEDEEGTDIQEADCLLPIQLRRAFARLSVVLDANVMYLWASPENISIHIESIKDEIHRPSRFLEALARKISKFAQ